MRYLLLISILLTGCVPGGPINIEFRWEKKPGEFVPCRDAGVGQIDYEITDEDDDVVQSGSLMPCTDHFITYVETKGQHNIHIIGQKLIKDGEDIIAVKKWETVCENLIVDGVDSLEAPPYYCEIWKIRN